jgi:DNA-binding XRE family transcriptional regulator
MTHNVVPFPNHARVSSTPSKAKKSSAVTAPSVTRAMRSATSREGHPLPSQSAVIQPPVTPMDCANSPRLMLFDSKYSASFMETTFSAAKTLAQVKVLVPLHGQEGAPASHFSMGKKLAAKRKPAEKAPPPPLQRTYIREWRVVRGLSQTELGEAVELSTATISQIENAKTGYSQANLEAIALALNVHPIDLLVCDPKDHPKGIWVTVSAILA